jgi:hypothetical protein
MADDEAPREVVDLADARAEARRARDWATADALLARIESAGWKVVDAASLYTLVRAAPADVIEDGVVRHGSSASVPSMLDTAPTAPATVVVVATDAPAALARSVESVARHALAGTQLVVVANRSSEAASGDLAEREAAAAAAIAPAADGMPMELVRTSVRVGAATAWNMGIRRATAPVVALLQAGAEWQGDLVSALCAALGDPTIAVAGPVGLVTNDLRRFDAAPADASDVDAIDGTLVAFRRADYVERGPLDEHFIDPAGLDVWWSLVLRDAADDEGPARRAVQVGGALIGRNGTVPTGGDGGPDHDRLARRNRYRILKRFATRRDLLTNG